jgi:hypothetical protein
MIEKTYAKILAEKRRDFIVCQQEPYCCSPVPPEASALDEIPLRRGAPVRHGRSALHCGAPVRLSAQETKVLFLIAKHPYVPVLLVTNGAMHDFAFEDFEQEFLALLAKKYKGLQIDVIHSVRDGSRSR